MFGTRDVATYYERTEQTIRAWADEFSEYLSPMATPGKGRGRTFTPDDLTVFALITELKDQNKTYEDIHAVLKTGQRGSPPDLTEKDLRLLSATEGEKRAVLEIQVLQKNIIDLTERLNRAEQKATQVDELNRQNASLQTEVRLLREQLEQTSDQLHQFQEEIKTLAQQTGKEYTKGFLDALREKGDLSDTS